MKIKKESSPSNQKKIPISLSEEILTWIIFVDDEPIDKEIELAKLTVVHQLNKLSFAEVSILMTNNYQELEKAFHLAINKKIKIQMGYQNNLETIFIGHIVSQRITQFLDEPNVLIVHCEDNLSEPIHSGIDTAPILNLNYGMNILGFDLSINKDAKIKGIVSIPGIHEQFLGNYIKLNDLFADFNKILKVFRVEHFLDNIEWRTILSVSDN